MFELRGTLTCDRCNTATIEMVDLSDEADARSRLSDGESGWCESEDGEDVCPACWAKWEARNTIALPSAPDQEQDT